MPSKDFTLTADGKQAVEEFRRVGKEYSKLVKQFRSEGMSAQRAEATAMKQIRDRMRGQTPQDPVKGGFQKGGTGIRKTGVTKNLTDQEFMSEVMAQKREDDREEAKSEAQKTRTLNANRKQRAALLKQLRSQTRRLVIAQEDLVRSHNELGHNSRTSTAQLDKQRYAIERLQNRLQRLAAQSKITGKSFKVMNADLARSNEALMGVRPQVEQYSQGMRFMAGASVKAQGAIRGVGAAAQGSMLAMSLMNGDVLGLAFSLIFLQFAANIKVALGFAAIAAAGFFAFKKLKEYREEVGRVNKLSQRFVEITGSTEAMGIATEKAKNIAKEFNLEWDKEAELVKSMTQAQMQLLDQGIHPTNKALAASASFWLIARHRGEDYKTAMETASKATVEFAKNGVAKIGDAEMTFEALQQRSGRALQAMIRDQEFLNVSITDVKDAYKRLGVEVPEEVANLVERGRGLGKDPIRVGTLTVGYEPEDMRILREHARILDEMGSSLAQGLIVNGLNAMDEAYKRVATQTIFKDARDDYEKLVDSTTEYNTDYFKELDGMLEKWNAVDEVMNRVLTTSEQIHSVDIGRVTREKFGGIQKGDWGSIHGVNPATYQGEANERSVLKTAYDEAFGVVNTMRKEPVLTGTLGKGLEFDQFPESNQLYDPNRKGMAGRNPSGPLSINFYGDVHTEDADAFAKTIGNEVAGTGASF